MIDSIKDKLAQTQGEYERLVEFQKEIVQGKNKENCKQDFENLFYRTKKNTKNSWNIIEKAKTLNSNSSSIW